MQTLRKRRRIDRRYDPKASFQLVQSDQQRFWFFGHFPVLTAELIAGLMDKPNKNSERRRLPQLAQQRYLKSYNPKNTIQLPLHWPDFYQMTDLGADEHLCTYGRLPLPTIDNHTNFLHDFTITNVIASIAIDCPHDMIYWADIKDRKPDATLELPFSLPTFSGFLKPDGIFGIRYPNGKASFFAVEVERGNGLKKTLHKLKAYQNIQETRAYQTHLGIPNLRVLVVTPTSAKTQSIIRAAKLDTNQFLLRNVPMHKPNKFNGLTGLWERFGREPIALVVE